MALLMLYTRALALSKNVLDWDQNCNRNFPDGLLTINVTGCLYHRASVSSLLAEQTNLDSELPFTLENTEH